MEWRTIDSAPKDGTPVIILVKEMEDRMAIEAHYTDGDWNVVWLDAHGCGCCGGGKPDPSHWIPKPELPG